MSSGPTFAPSTRFPGMWVPAVCTTDVAQVAYQNIVEYEADFQLITQIVKTLAPGDPVRILLLRMAARESQLRGIINYGFQQNFIISAVGYNLDAIGANYGIGPGTPGASSGLNGQRLQPSYAVTTFQFTLSAAINVDLPIDIGTQIGTMGGIVFATTAVLIIPAGQLTGTVDAQCTQPGTVGNGFAAGQIDTLLNWNYPYVVTVTNTDVTEGGADLETDDAYAQRLALLPGAFSVAGPAGAYRYWGFTANTSIVDVSVITPNTTPSVAAGNVNVCILLQGGVIPDSTVLAEVAAVFNNDIRPQGDVVTVIAPTITNYNVSLTWYVHPSKLALQPTIDIAVNAAVAQFNTYISNGLGRTISPGYLEYLLWQAGVSDATITAPVDTPLDLVHVGVQSGTMSIVYGGTRY